MNETLDRLIPPKQLPTVSPSYDSRPADALLSYIHRPQVAHEENEPSLFPCLTRDASGKTALERWLPPICNGETENVVEATNPSQIEYVDFSLVDSAGYSAGVISESPRLSEDDIKKNGVSCVVVPKCN